jgi:hypothetical protein
MKRLIMIVALTSVAQIFFAPAVNAFPGERIPYRTAHFAHKVVYKIDKHVIHPVSHGIARRVR